jgi:hypothetical protein
MKRALVLAGAMGLLAVTARAADWVVVREDNYGFAMSMPKGTKTSGKDFGGGWGGGYAKYGVTEFFGIAKLGVYGTPAEIEEFAIRASGVPGPRWTKLDEGVNNRNGWKWYRSYRASSDTQVVFAVLGTGPRGSYCIFLRTTIADFKSGEAAYEKWYNSLTVY